MEEYGVFAAMVYSALYSVFAVQLARPPGSENSSSNGKVFTYAKTTEVLFVLARGDKQDSESTLRTRRGVRAGRREAKCVASGQTRRQQVECSTILSEMRLWTR